MSRYVYSAICPKHGYHQGGDCPKCEDEWIGEAFMTNKDQLYNFHSSALGIKIESKTQWRKELKQRGLTDDFTQGSARIKEIPETNIPKIKMSREEIKNNVRQELKDRGLYSREKLFLKSPKTWRVG